MKAVRILGWGWIWLSVTVLFVFGTIRIADMASSTAGGDAFSDRYVEHPVVALIHFLPGLWFVLFAPFQFMRRVRRRIDFHRWNGRLLVVFAAVSGVYAYVAAFTLPAFGGWSTISATVVFATVFLYSLGRAWLHIRRHEVAQHREWMIRMFAIGIAVATIRAIQGLADAIFGIGLEGSFGAAFWMAFPINLVAAELWIRATRKRPAFRPNR